VRRSQDLVLYVGLVIAIVLAIVVSLSLGYESTVFMIKEGGPVESLTAVLYVVCFIIILVSGRWAFLRDKPYFALLPVIFCMRELDFDKRFTGIKFYKIKFFLSDDISLLGKIFAFSVLVTILLLVYSMIKNHWRTFVLEVRERTSFGIGVLVVFSLCVVAKSIDGLGRKLRSVGLEASPAVEQCAAVVEEYVELGIPLAMLIVFVSYFRRRNRAAMVVNTGC
jgi:hypothetical protein